MPRHLPELKKPFIYDLIFAKETSFSMLLHIVPVSPPVNVILFLLCSFFSSLITLSRGCFARSSRLSNSVRTRNNVSMPVFATRLWQSACSEACDICEMDRIDRAQGRASIENHVEDIRLCREISSR